MSTIDELKKTIAHHKEQVAFHSALQRHAIQELQSLCTHPLESVVEGEYESDPLGGCWHSAPFRVCRACGYAEQGWGAGFWKLSNNYSGVPMLQREEARKLIVGPIVTQEMMGTLGRYGKRNSTP